MISTTRSFILASWKSYPGHHQGGVWEGLPRQPTAVSPTSHDSATSGRCVHRYLLGILGHCWQLT
ncbi:hypothetical protein IG631_18707 [Alternaria alternata]|nr:hypothetical protein IG631_18707 [Alternaria alternata]